jgi:hypothetical protein
MKYYIVKGAKDRDFNMAAMPMKGEYIVLDNKVYIVVSVTYYPDNDEIKIGVVSYLSFIGLTTHGLRLLKRLFFGQKH